jgi:hypothetical protein
VLIAFSPGCCLCPPPMTEQREHSKGVAAGSNAQRSADAKDFPRRRRLTRHPRCRFQTVSEQEGDSRETPHAGFASFPPTTLKVCRWPSFQPIPGPHLVYSFLTTAPKPWLT